VSAGAARTSTPRDRIAAAASLHGEATLVAACVSLLAGEEVDDELVIALGGPHGAKFLAGGAAAYWGRVWGARGLLYVWDDTAMPVLCRAATDSSWRVREMVAKVVAKRRLDDAASCVAQLQSDAVPRVRAAAERALGAVARDGRAPSRRRTTAS
jgi:HEAT repeat protein